MASGRAIACEHAIGKLDKESICIYNGRDRIYLLYNIESQMISVNTNDFIVTSVDDYISLHVLS